MRPDIFIHMMSSNIALEFKNIGNTNIYIETCALFSYHRFKMDSGKFKSYTLTFKKRFLIRLEENDDNISKTAQKYNIHRKNLQRWIQ